MRIGRPVELSNVSSSDSLGRSKFADALPGLQTIVRSSEGDAGRPLGGAGIFVLSGAGKFLSAPALAGVALGSKLTLKTSSGDRFEARVTELRPLGEFAVWRAARAVGDHDLNSFLLRADPIGPAPGLEPGMSVWIDEEAGAPATAGKR